MIEAKSNQKKNYTDQPMTDYRTNIKQLFNAIADPNAPEDTISKLIDNTLSKHGYTIFYKQQGKYNLLQWAIKHNKINVIIHLVKEGMSVSNKLYYINFTDRFKIRPETKNIVDNLKKICALLKKENNQNQNKTKNKIKKCEKEVKKINKNNEEEIFASILDASLRYTHGDNENLINTKLEAYNKEHIKPNENNKNNNKKNPNNVDDEKNNSTKNDTLIKSNEVINLESNNQEEYLVSENNKKENEDNKNQEILDKKINHLHCATAYGDFETVKRLINQEKHNNNNNLYDLICSPTSNSKNKRTSLHFAVLGDNKNQAKILKFLADQQSNQIADVNTETPADIAKRIARNSWNYQDIQKYKIFAELQEEKPSNNLFFYIKFCLKNAKKNIKNFFRNFIYENKFKAISKEHIENYIKNYHHESNEKDIAILIAEKDYFRLLEVLQTKNNGVSKKLIKEISGKSELSDLKSLLKKALENNDNGFSDSLVINFILEILYEKTNNEKNDNTDNNHNSNENKNKSNNEIKKEGKIKNNEYISNKKTEENIITENNNIRNKEVIILKKDEKIKENISLEKILNDLLSKMSESFNDGISNRYSLTEYNSKDKNLSDNEIKKKDETERNGDELNKKENKEINENEDILKKQEENNKKIENKSNENIITEVNSETKENEIKLDNNLNNNIEKKTIKSGNESEKLKLNKELEICFKNLIISAKINSPKMINFYLETIKNKIDKLNPGNENNETLISNALQTMNVFPGELECLLNNLKNLSGNNINEDKVQNKTTSDINAKKAIGINKEKDEIKINDSESKSNVNYLIKNIKTSCVEYIKKEKEKRIENINNQQETSEAQKITDEKYDELIKIREDELSNDFNEIMGGNIEIERIFYLKEKRVNRETSYKEVINFDKKNEISVYFEKISDHVNNVKKFAKNNLKSYENILKEEIKELIKKDKNFDDKMKEMVYCMKKNPIFYNGNVAELVMYYGELNGKNNSDTFLLTPTLPNPMNKNKKQQDKYTIEILALMEGISNPINNIMKIEINKNKYIYKTQPSGVEYDIKNTECIKKELKKYERLMKNPFVKKIKSKSEELFQNKEKEENSERMHMAGFTTKLSNNDNLLEYVTKNQQTLPLSKILTIFCKIAKGVSYIHDDKLVWRDLKPENILINKNEDPRFIDFYTLTKAGKPVKAEVGTAGYIAPEAHVKTTADSSQDIYSFGKLMQKILCCVSLNKHNNSNNIELNNAYNTNNYEGLDLKEILKKRYAFLQENKNDGDKDDENENKPLINENSESSQPQNELFTLIDQCVNEDPKNRPSMKEITKQLLEIQKKIAEIENKDEEKIEKNNINPNKFNNLN